MKKLLLTIFMTLLATCAYADDAGNEDIMKVRLLNLSNEPITIHYNLCYYKVSPYAGVSQEKKCQEELSQVTLAAQSKQVLELPAPHPLRDKRFHVAWDFYKLFVTKASAREGRINTDYTGPVNRETRSFCRVIEDEGLDLIAFDVTHGTVFCTSNFLNQELLWDLEALAS